MALYSIQLLTRLGVVIGAFGNPSGISYSQYLNLSGGDFNCSVPVDDPIITPTGLDGYAFEINTLRRDDDAPWRPVFSGPISEPNLDTASSNGSTPTVTIKALPAFTWLDRRIIKKDLTYTSMWVGDIIQDLWNRAQNPAEYGPNAAIRYQLRLPPRSSTRITVTVSGRDQKGYGTVIRSLAAHVDLREEYDLINGEVIRTLAVYEPSIASLADTPLIFGKTTSGISATRPMVATRIAGIGSSSTTTTTTPAAAPPVSVATNASLESYYGVLEVPYADTTVTDQATLDSMTRMELGVYQPRWLVGASYTPSVATPFGFLHLGDSVLIGAQVGNWGTRDSRKVTGLAVSVDANGGETITPTTSEPPDLSGDVTSISVATP